MATTTFGKKSASGGPAGKPPAFGKKSSPVQSGRAQSAGKASAQSGLSSGALAFLETERNRPPAAASTPAGWPQQGRAASAAKTAGKPVWGRRVIATLIDAAVFMVPLIVIIAAMGPQPGMTDAQFATGYVSVILFLILGSLAYAIGMEASASQATLGKLAVGAIVTDKTGGKPTLGAVILRNTLGKFASGITPFYISYLMGLARQDRRCLHDLIAGTMVCARGKAELSYDQTFA